MSLAIAVLMVDGNVVDTKVSYEGPLTDAKLERFFGVWTETYGSRPTLLNIVPLAEDPPAPRVTNLPGEVYYVSGCAYCPMAEKDRKVCGAYDGGGDITNSLGNGYPHPMWCPLTKHYITIRLRE